MSNNTIEKEPKSKEAKPKELLPKKPSVLLRLALKDLEVCRNSPDYTISMGHWYYKDADDLCSVCLAGAVMSQTLGLDPGESQSCGPYTSDLSISDNTRNRLLALNSFRCGNLLGGLNRLGCKPPKDLPETVRITQYEISPEKFLEDMYKLVETFERFGI